MGAIAGRDGAYSIVVIGAMAGIDGGKSIVVKGSSETGLICGGGAMDVSAGGKFMDSEPSVVGGI